MQTKPSDEPVFLHRANVDVSGDIICRALKSRVTSAPHVAGSLGPCFITNRAPALLLSSLHTGANGVARIFIIRLRVAFRSDTCPTVHSNPLPLAVNRDSLVRQSKRLTHLLPDATHRSPSRSHPLASPSLTYRYVLTSTTILFSRICLNFCGISPTTRDYGFNFQAIDSRLIFISKVRFDATNEWIDYKSSTQTMVPYNREK